MEFTYSTTLAGTSCNVAIVDKEHDVYQVSVTPFENGKAVDSVVMHEFSKDVLKRFLEGLVMDNQKMRPSQDEVKAVIENLAGWVNRPRWYLSATGMGNYSTSTSGAKSTGAAAGFGVSVDWKDGHRINVIGTVTQTRDTIIGIDVPIFSQTVLVPGIRRFSILAIYRNLYAIKKRSNGSGMGWGFFVNATPLNWKTYQDTSAHGKERDTIAVVQAVTPFTVELFASTTLLHDRSATNSARITLDYGLSFKYLNANGMSSRNHRLFLGSTQDFFAGPMCGLDIRIADSHMYFYGTYLFQAKQGAVPGLTGPQLHAGISLTATISGH